jgi:deazaflavin-dependent oxidoreductase (nitroreductase family)
MRDGKVKALSRLHRALYRGSRGWMGARLGGLPMLLLTTTGRYSGRPHTVPLLYLTEREALVVIASYGGRPRHPDWYRNLVSRPRAQVQVGRRHLAVRAERAGPEEKARLWPRIVATFPDYQRYQERSTRDIPVVLLHPS